MKNLKKSIFMLSIVLACAASFITAGAAPAKTVMTEKAGAANAISVYDSIKNFGSVMGTYVFDNGDGTLCAVDAENSEVVIDTYNKDTFELTGTKSIPFELNKFGGAYSGKEYNFIVFGQSNPGEDDNVTTFKTVKYSKNWEKLGEADYKNNNTTEPFEAGSLRMAEHNGYLYVRSAHEMYTSSDGLNHQSNITYSVDISSMTVADEFSKVWNVGGGYVSHSFNQFIIIDGGQLVCVDHGDAYPRSIVLGKYNSNLSGGKFSGNYSHVDLLEIPGSIGDNYTGVSVGGFEASADNYITAVNSVNFESSDTNSRDILLLVSGKDNMNAQNVKHVYLTNYSDTGKVGSTPYLVKINDNKFAVLWTEFENNLDKGVRYVYTDGSGNMISDVQTFDNAVLSSGCQPVVVDGNNIVWFTNTGDGRKFCVINTDGYDIGENAELSEPVKEPTVENIDNTVNAGNDENYGAGEGNRSDVTEDNSITDEDSIIEDKDNVIENEDKTGTDTTSAEDEEKPITVWLDGSKLEFDVEPIIESGRTLVPMRVIFEALGADVTWDNDIRTAIAVRDGIEIRISIDKTVMKRNGETIILDVPARLRNSRTLVPVRAVSEGLNAKVDWIDAEKKVVIETEKQADTDKMKLSEADAELLTDMYGEIRYMFEQYTLPEKIRNEEGIAEGIKNQDESYPAFVNTVWNNTIGAEVIDIQIASETTYVLSGEDENDMYNQYMDIIKDAELNAESIFDVSYEVTENGNVVLLIEFKKTDTLLACKYIGITATNDDGIRYFTAETDAFIDSSEAFFCEVGEDVRYNFEVIKCTEETFLSAIDQAVK